LTQAFDSVAMVTRSKSPKRRHQHDSSRGNGGIKIDVRLENKGLFKMERENEREMEKQTMMTKMSRLTGAKA